jgi:hypothetical protein
LHLGSTAVADSGLSCFKGADYAELRELHLFETKITDIGLRYLCNFSGLPTSGFAVLMQESVE